MNESFRFTTLEEFLFWEDRPAYPWSCFGRLHLKGQLDRTAFTAAVRRVLKRHPLLSARARMGRGAHLYWVVEDEPQAAITWESGPIGRPFPAAKHLDLTREIGIRFHVVSDGNDCELVIQFHHACCDGAGMFAVIDELLIAYALAVGPASDGLQLPSLDPARLASRGKFGLTFWKFLRMVPRQAVGLLGARQFLMRSPEPIIPHQPCDNEAPVPPTYPAILNGILETAETANLRRAAMQKGVRLNDLLTTNLFLALDEWRTRHNAQNDGWLRMMVPINLRTAADRKLSAVCLASSIFLDRRHADCMEPEALLGGIHEEMDLILSHQLGFTFVFFSRLFNLIPGELKRRTRAPHCSMSCIFTNVGKLFVRSPLPRQAGRLVAGNVTLESFDTVAPNRPYTCATFAASIYASRLAITLHYDPRPLTGPQAADLLDAFLTRLRTVRS